MAATFAPGYHFWMQDMDPIRRGDGAQHPHRQSSDYRQHLRRKLAAYERHIQLGLIAQGLLQYLAMTFRRVVWFNFHSYIRTRSPQKPPSEWVVTHALRHSWPHFLAGSPESHYPQEIPRHQNQPRPLRLCGYPRTGKSGMNVLLSSNNNSNNNPASKAAIWIWSTNC